MALSLPIDSLRADLEAAWSRHRNFLLRAPTGSGKSTRVPRFLLQWPGFPAGQRVLILQPRRVAARLLARRVAGELGEPPGRTAGYAVRFEACQSRETRLLYVTEGLLLRRLLAGEGLRGVGAVIFDEFHERHLEGDLGLALLVREQAAGWGGRIGVMSATLEGERLEGWLPEAASLESGGRGYPVEVSHAGGGGGAPVWERAAGAVRAALASGASADLLVFMPGQREIRRTLERLRGLPELRGWELCGLYGDLPAAEQDRVLGQGEGPRVIVSTNLAETSVTLPGVRTVIDSGLARIPDFDPRRGINRLLTGTISRASAEQRSGRAGRVAPGRCVRLWSEAEEARWPEQTLPEIRRLDLTEVRLQLLAAGMEQPFPWLEPPPEANWDRAGRLLEELEAVKGGELTETGREMAALPLHPRFSRILVEAARRKCLDLALPVVALAEGRSLLLPLADAGRARERERWLEPAEGLSDHLAELAVWERVRASGNPAAFCREWGLSHAAFRNAGQVMQQLARLVGEPEASGGGGVEAFCKCLLTGYVDQLARRTSRGTLRCDLVGGRRGELSRQSRVREAGLVVATEAEEREVRGEVTLMLGACTAVQRDWLKELFPDAVQHRFEERLNRETRRVERVETVRFRDLVLETREAGPPDLTRAAEVLARCIHEAGWPLKQWNTAAENWILRVNVLAAHCPELEISGIGEADRLFLIEQICEGATAYKEVKDRPVLPVLHSWIPEALHPLVEAWTPERFPLPGGSRPRLRYEPDGSVVLPARIQQLYDVAGDSLAICQGRCRLKLEILAPNGRPVQVTDDLDGFWKGQYPAIRKELFGRYPKHEWR